MTDTQAKSDLDVLRLALTEVTDRAFDTTAASAAEMLVTLQELVTNASREELALLAGNIAKHLGQPPAFCAPPNIRFRRVSPVANNSLAARRPNAQGC